MGKNDSGLNASQKINRREFLRIFAAAGIGGLCLKAGLSKLNAEQVVHVSQVMMGTVVNLTLISPDVPTARNTAQACFKKMKRLETIFTRFEPSSQVSILNLTGRITSPDPGFYEVLHLSQKISQLSQGAFDVTVKPLYDLYAAYASRHGDMPSRHEISQILGKVDYRKLHLSPHEVQFLNTGMQITLDGIAKGYIIDQGVAVLRKDGFTNVMVEAGGDLAAFGMNAADMPWRIGVQSPRGKIGEIISSVGVQNACIATSGDYLQPFTPDLKQHHILDPRVGASPGELASVTVIAPSCTLADGLATAIMVTGSREGISLINKLSNCQAILITKSGETIRSS